MNRFATSHHVRRFIDPGDIPMPRSLLDPLGRILPRAGMPVRPETYLASVYLHAVSTLLVGCVVALGAHLLLTPSVAHALLLWAVPVVAAGATFGTRYGLPWNRASQRRKQIDSRLPFALNYISTMASAGMPPDRIFWSLSKQDVYGEVAVEAKLVSRDLKGLGVDLRTAFRSAMERTPSVRMAAFLQGAITTLATGEDLAEYFLVKSEQFAYENRQQERRFLDSLGVLAESYITLIVAAPIFMIILLSVMVVFGAGAQQMLAVGYILVLVLIPTAQAFFAGILETMTPEL